MKALLIKNLGVYPSEASRLVCEANGTHTLSGAFVSTSWFNGLAVRCGNLTAIFCLTVFQSIKKHVLSQNIVKGISKNPYFVSAAF